MVESIKSESPSRKISADFNKIESFKNAINYNSSIAGLKNNMTKIPNIILKKSDEIEINKRFDQNKNGEISGSLENLKKDFKSKENSLIKLKDSSVSPIQNKFDSKKFREESNQNGRNSPKKINKNINFNTLANAAKNEASSYIHSLSDIKNNDKKKSNPLPRVKLPQISLDINNQNPLCNSQNTNSKITNELTHSLKISLPKSFQNAPKVTLSPEFNKKKLMPIKMKKFKKTCAVKTREGYIRKKNLRKTNQDNYLILEKIFNIENFAIYAVFDGHGINGHHISGFLKLFIENYMKFNEFVLLPRKATKNLEEQIYLKLEANNYEFIRNMFDRMEKECKELDYNSEFSGSTINMVVLIGNKIICANTGDSRSILVNEKKKIYPLSNDHKPEKDSEKERIILNGGRVARACDFGVEMGPYRVWLRDDDYPGLAMSRSIGDFCAKTAGVIHDPEIFEVSVFSNSKFIVIGSDGIWECLTNGEVADLVEPYYLSNDVSSAVLHLVDAANRSWVNEVRL
jgi:serine/threonine protein phosphatase PrpC